MDDRRQMAFVLADGQYLTPRELETLKLVASDKLTKEIAEIFGISIKTVEKYRDNIRAKLNIHTGVGLTLYAVKHRLVDPFT